MFVKSENIFVWQYEMPEVNFHQIRIPKEFELLMERCFFVWEKNPKLNTYIIAFLNPFYNWKCKPLHCRIVRTELQEVLTLTMKPSHFLAEFAPESPPSLLKEVKCPACQAVVFLETP